nr:hypothetical protein [Deltaproteobacteria bacterium]
MKKVLLFVAIALMLAVPSAQAETEVNLIADGRETAAVVGTVTISNTAAYLYVTFDIDTVNTAWEMTETHLGIDGGIIKNRSGNPKVGKFTAGGYPGGVDHDPAVDAYTYTISLEDLGVNVGDTIDIAAHTAIEYVEAIDEDDGYPDQPLVDDILHEESAWGDGEP